MRSRWFCVILTTLATLAGCQANGPSHGHGTPAAEQAANTDPCATQLHDIAGAILFYYALNKRMPLQLSDLETVADMDTPLRFSCPVSGLPYLYYPEGLISPDGMGAIIVCDATPAHDGKRWCIIEGVAKGKTLSLQVEELTEDVFNPFGAGGGQ